MFVSGNSKRGPKRAPGETRRLVADLRARGLSSAQIAERLGVTKGVVTYHTRRMGIEPDLRFGRRYDWSEIQAAYDTGLSVRQCAKRFGFSLASWHKAVKRGDVVARPRAMDIHLLLVPDRPETGHSHLKQRLLTAGLKENRCELCGITEWQGKPIVMHLHHINGDGHDNRIENIALLCGNCHSQTDTYGGRNGHRRKRAA